LRRLKRLSSSSSDRNVQRAPVEAFSRNTSTVIPDFRLRDENVAVHGEAVDGVLARRVREIAEELARSAVGGVAHDGLVVGVPVADVEEPLVRRERDPVRPGELVRHERHRLVGTWLLIGVAISGRRA
jgi:hypothetical protein